MPYLPVHQLKSMRQPDLDRAERSRLLRAARTGRPGAYGAGVIDALGHGLIAIGMRLVSDPNHHPTHRSAA